MAGNGVPNAGNDTIFEPTTGDLLVRFSLGSHFDLDRGQHNAVRAAGLAAGGMSDVSAAYTAIRAEMDAIESGRAAWLDHYTTGMNSAETTLIRRGAVWHFVARGEIPGAPQP